MLPILRDLDLTHPHRHGQPAFGPAPAFSDEPHNQNVGIILGTSDTLTLVESPSGPKTEHRCRKRSALHSHFVSYPDCYDRDDAGRWSDELYDSAVVPARLTAMSKRRAGYIGSLQT